MTYYYLLDNGEAYSDYAVVGVMESEEEMTVERWKRLTEQMAAWLNENVDIDDWWIDNRVRAEMLAAVGIKTLPLQPASFSCDPRRVYDVWSFASYWDRMGVGDERKRT